ncbi:DNA-directed RNA polymerase subunit alpha [Patescibacteria group bacterium]|nr:DNA-directed RNA polymerase subunit alpha [Patescibacteria group bacterium]
MLKSNFKVTVGPVKNNTAEVIIEPLPRNFGHTVGNALRRVLLNSLYGGAAIRVKIAGVSHQFSTLSGLQEDILEFILNLKELNFQLGDQDTAQVKLSVSGKKTVTAKDLELPAGVTVNDPEKVLARLTSPKSKLSAVITVAKGVGYVLSDEHMVDKLGVIPLDAAFSPVINATYTVESTRVGRHTDYDKVRLNLTTNGTIDPKTAVDQAAEILSTFFTQVYSPAPVEKESSKPIKDKVLDGFIEDLDLPTRTTNALKKGGYEKLQDLAGANVLDLSQVKNLGGKSVEEIVKKLKTKDIIIK